jgi:hypothetical protein
MRADFASRVSSPFVAMAAGFQDRGCVVNGFWAASFRAPARGEEFGRFAGLGLALFRGVSGARWSELFGVGLSWPNEQWTAALARFTSKAIAGQRRAGAAKSASIDAGARNPTDCDAAPSCLPGGVARANT